MALGFMGEYAADDLENPEWLALMERVVPCRCGRVELDDEDLSRGSLAGLARSHGWLTSRGLLLAGVDYAHRMGGCAHQAAVIREIADAPAPADEPEELSALLARLLDAPTAPCDAVLGAFAIPGTEGRQAAPRPAGRAVTECLGFQLDHRDGSMSCSRGQHCPGVALPHAGWRDCPDDCAYCAGPPRVWVHDA